MIISTCLILSACSGYITGRVYVDENNNGILESSESPVPYAMLTVALGLEKIDEVQTDAGGSFRVKAGRVGRYCINLDSNSLETAVNSVPMPRAIGISFPSTPSTAPATDPQSGTQCVDLDNNGRCDGGCVDADNDGACDSECVDANSDGRCDEQCRDANSDGRCDGNCVDSNRDGTCDADRCVDANHDGRCDTNSDSAQPSSNTAQAPPGWSGQGYCFTNSDYETVANVPVRIDYNGANANSSVSPARTCHVGRTCELSFAIPRGCGLETLILPEGLTQGARAMIISNETQHPKFTTSGDRTFSNSGTGTRSPMITPELETMRIPIYVDPNIPRETTSVTLAPRADCGSEDITLSPVTISIVRTVSAFVALNLINNPEAGREIDVSVTLENRGDAPIEFGELAVEIPEDTRIAAVDRACGNLGNRMLCPIRELAPDATLSATVSIGLPAAPVIDTEYEIGATFSSEEFDEDITATPVAFTVSAPEPDEPASTPPTPPPPAPPQGYNGHYSVFNGNVFQIAR